MTGVRLNVATTPPATVEAACSHSCERRLGIEFWLPVLDCFVVDVLAAVFDGFDGQAVDHVEDVCRDTTGRGPR